MLRTKRGPTLAVVLVAGLSIGLGATGRAAAQAADPMKAGVPATRNGEPPARIAAPALPSMLVFTVDVKLIGVSPYRMERDVTARIEQAVKTLPGVLLVHSTVTGSRAQTQISFDSKGDAASIATAIRSRLDQIKTRFPHGASQPLIAWRREPADRP